MRVFVKDPEGPRINFFATQIASDKDREFFRKHRNRNAYFREAIKGEIPNYKFEYVLVFQRAPGARTRFAWPFPLPALRDDKICLKAAELMAIAGVRGFHVIAEIEEFLRNAMKGKKHKITLELTKEALWNISTSKKVNDVVCMHG